jgi:hypothetical protein
MLLHSLVELSRAVLAFGECLNEIRHALRIAQPLI